MEPVARLTELNASPHLWMLPVELPLDTAWVVDHEPLLSADEHLRYRRYRRDDDQQLFLAAHVFVRQTLSRYASIPPADWTFAPNDQGRPEISNPDSPPSLRFNLAHTAGMVALLVHDQANGGVDVEHLGNVADPVTMSRTVFANTERNDFLALDVSLQEQRFYQLWTLKEAFIKAKGKGLALPLKDFAFSGLDDCDIHVECGPEIDVDPAAWHFTLHQPSPQFVVATAYCTDDTQQRSVSIQTGCS